MSAGLSSAASPTPSAAEVRFLRFGSYLGRVVKRSIRTFPELPAAAVPGSVTFASKLASVADMPCIEHVSDSDLERLALGRFVPALKVDGFYYVDSFLGKVAGDAVLEQVADMHRSGALQDGRLAGSVPGIHRRNIRGDKIAWVGGSERGCEAIRFLLNLIDKLVSICARHFGNKAIRERSKAMVACYPGNGAGYVKHVDNPNSDGRCITCIYYLNKNWNAKEHGGVLRIFPEGKAHVADIEPLFDRLVLFWSDRRNPHEVQPSYATRYAITVWYFDSEERAEAKRRYLTASTQQQGSSST